MFRRDMFRRDMFQNQKHIFATVLFLFVLTFTAAASAQINGVPASVTSIGFGGRGNMTPGVPASVTSLGPHGFSNSSGFRFTTCCFNNGFVNHPNQPIFQHGHHRGGFFPVAVPYYYAPAYTPVVVVQQPVDDYADDEDGGGPTIFDRRGSGRRTRTVTREADPAPEPTQAVAAIPSAPVSDQPETVLIFKDGHRAEIRNYAIVGDTLYDFTGVRHRIALADLDLSATTKENDERGIDFHVPAVLAR
jgi:hypothetical protein